MTKVAVVLLAGLLLAGCFHKGKPAGLGKEAAGGGEGVEIEDRVSKISKQFGVTIAENVQKAALNSIDNSGATGLATRDDRGLVTILANLPDLTGKDKYSVYFIDNNQKIFLGDLSVAKAGWMLEKTVSMDPLVNRTIEVLRGETRVLRGEFK